MSAHQYYEGVAALHDKIGTQIRALKEAKKIISSSPVHRNLPGLIGTTPKEVQSKLLLNAWIVLSQIDNTGEFASDIRNLEKLLKDVGDCPLREKELICL